MDTVINHPGNDFIDQMSNVIKKGVNLQTTT